MANEHLPNTKTRVVQFSALVTRADPNWARDYALIPEFNEQWGGADLPRERLNVRVDWRHRGPFDGTHRNEFLMRNGIGSTGGPARLLLRDGSHPLSLAH